VKHLSALVSSVIVSLFLAWGPAIAQEAVDADATTGNPATARDTTDNDDDGPDLGWLGLLGLAGLGGLLRRERHDDHRRDKVTNH
jgi:MYXO-CTERM domain-containing protein